MSKYSLTVMPGLDKKLEKLSKKDKKKYEIIMKKTEEVLENPERYKNLQKPLQHLKRVHIDKHFVLTFSVNEEDNIVVLEDFNHHDNIYQ